jgi:hypothetical protein
MSKRIEHKEEPITGERAKRYAEHMGKYSKFLYKPILKDIKL